MTDLTNLRQRLRSGLMIPAHPLALSPQRTLDERRQCALTRYYIEAGCGGLAVGVHTTQFAIRRKDIGLYKPILELAASTSSEYSSRPILIAGVMGDTAQAIREAQLARDLGYDAVLTSLSGLGALDENALLQHCYHVGEVMPLMGFYLQPAVGGIPLPYSFWRRFAENPSVVAIKIAPFNRYQTVEVVRGVIDSGHSDDISLYTGNDDSIVTDLLTSFDFGHSESLHIVGGLLGHWAVWSYSAVRLFNKLRSIVSTGADIPQSILRLAAQVTDANAAFFDAANSFRGSIAGLHEVLRRQGLMAGTWCLDPEEKLSPGQQAEIDRVYQAYPHLNDDEFVQHNLVRWLR